MKKRVNPPKVFGLVHRGSPLWVAAVLVLTGAIQLLTVHLAPPHAALTWWPASGALTAALLMSARPWRALVLVVGAAAVLLPLLSGDHWIPSTLFLTATCLTATVAGVAVFRFRTADAAPSFSTQDDLVRLVAATLIGAGVSALGVALGHAVGLLEDGSPMRSAAELSSAHAASVMVLTPLLLPRPHRDRPGRTEALAQWITLAGVCLLCLVFGGPLAALVLGMPLLVLGAYRLGLNTTVRQLALMYLLLSPWAAQALEAMETVRRSIVPLDLAPVMNQLALACAAILCLPTAMAMIQGRELARQLRAERDLSEMTLATAGCLVVVTDMAGTLLRVNQTAVNLLGVPSGSLLGRPAWNLVAREYRSSARRLFAAPDGSSMLGSFEGRMVDHTGQERRLLWTTGIVRSEDGTPTHVVLTGLDVTAELNAAGHTEHLLRAPIDTAIVGIDRQGRITLLNSGAEAVLGRTADEVVGTPFVGVLSAAELAEWARGFKVKPDFASLLAQAVDAAPRDWHWLGDGTSRLVSMELSRIIDNSGALIGYLCVANDVTEIRTRQQLLVDALDREREAVDRLRELDATKDHFVTTVSHELRTPVATIVGYTEMLTAGELGDLSAPQVKALTAVNRNAERLVTLVDNLLALAGLSGDSILRQRELIDLTEVAEEAERQFGALLQSRQLSAIFEFPRGPVLVAGERRQLALVLSNLLSNSVKFTEDGGEIRCRIMADGDRAVLEVIDNGLGIPEEEQHHLFDRFWRSSTAVARHIQGTGLGLATAQAIIAAHGGWITVTSAHLEGTTARVSLPLELRATTTTRTPRAERSRRERSGPSRPRSPGLPELTRRGKND